MSSELANALKDLSVQARELASRIEEGAPVGTGENGEIGRAVERLAALLSQANMKGFCSRCEDRDTCEKVCAEAEGLLPGVTAGRKHGEILCESLDAHPRAEIPMGRDIYMAYRNHCHLLNGKQRQAADMYYGEGRTQTEIACILLRARLAQLTAACSLRPAAQPADTDARHFGARILWDPDTGEVLAQACCHCPCYSDEIDEAMAFLLADDFQPISEIFPAVGWRQPAGAWKA